MHCATCGATLQHIDILIGHAIQINYHYRHANLDNCDVDGHPVMRRIPTSRIRPRLRHGKYRDGNEKIYSEPGRHDQVEHMKMRYSRVQSIASKVFNVYPPNNLVTGQALVRPTQLDMFDTQKPMLPLIFNLTVDSHYSRLIEIFKVSNLDTLLYGYADQQYWFKYGEYVYVSKDVVYLQGVQMAINDVDDLQMSILTADEFRDSLDTRPDSIPFQSVSMGEVHNNIVEYVTKYFFRYTRVFSQQGNYIIHSSTKDLFAGYVVGLRTLMEFDQ